MANGSDQTSLAATRICLIIPPSGFLLDERVFPSLGVLKVAAALEAAGIETWVNDLSGADQEFIRTARAPTRKADVYGITATMPQMTAAVEILKTIRREQPDARVILGGPHATLVAASARAGVPRAINMLADLRTLFDVVIAGDGERAIFQALAPDAPDFIDGDDPKSSLWLTPQALTDSPLPARHLINLSSYRYQIDGHKTTSLIAQLGCPFGCNFCGGRRSPFLRRVRLRSTEAVVAEIRSLYLEYGYTGFMFLDDELNVNPQFMGLLASLRDLQSELGVSFRMRGLVKSELVTAPMAAAMYATGFRQLLIGFESGSPRMLANMNKHATREDNTRCVALLRAAGIKVKALMSLGHPGESALTVQETQDWLLQVKPDDFDVTIITIYPGTPYFDDAKQLGYFGPAPIIDWTNVYTYTAANGDRLHSINTDHLHDINFYKGIPGQYQSFVWTDTLSRGQLVAARDRVEHNVREALKIPWPTGPSALQFEHSMGAR